MRARPRILLSAGEVSGDRLGAGLARALRARRPDLELAGMGGPLMREAGVEILQDSEEVSVVGISEVLAELPAIRRAMAKLEDYLKRESPDLLVPIDFPDFNLNLAARARRAAVRVVYFVSPQVWAWRRGRVRRIRRLVRRMLVLFPFETPFYEKEGVPVTFVGHPLAEPREAPAGSRERLSERLGLEAGRPLVALMPGSRRSELARLGPVLAATAARLHAAKPELQFVVPLAAGLDERALSAEFERLGVPGVRMHRGDWPEILRLARAGVVASGTASLEAALEGLPVVVVYRVSAPTYWLGRLLVRVEDIALPNLVAGRRVVPELIQGECNPERIAAELIPLIDEGERRRAVIAELIRVRELLGGPGAYDRAAEAVLAELDAAHAVK